MRMLPLSAFAKLLPCTRRDGSPVCSKLFSALRKCPRGALSFPRLRNSALPRIICSFGKGRGVYRIVLDIREKEQRVRVLRIWHGFRDALAAADMEEC